jgi:hypothetical protein
MYINEFYTNFISKSQKETGRLFEALRRMSRLDKGAVLAGDGDGDPSRGWVEWPPTDDGSGFSFGKA